MKKCLLIALAFLFASPCYAADKYGPSTATSYYTVYKDTGLTDPTTGAIIYVPGEAAVSTSVVGVTSTTTNSTVAVANTFQSALAASSTRKGCLIVNKSVVTLLVYMGTPGSATAAQSQILAAGTATADGGTFNCGSVQGTVATDQISITSATISAAYMVIAQ